MFGNNQRGVNVYAQVGLETGVLAANPNKLIIMLYEGAITACHRAIAHMQKVDIQNKGAMLSKAIMIIESGLRLSLDKQVGGEIAASLDNLYAYMSHRLVLANIHNQPEPVYEVIKLLTELKSAWETIGNEQAVSPEVAIAKPSQDIASNRLIANYAGA
jgi:flagellar secretion chaperone FliS